MWETKGVTSRGVVPWPRCKIHKCKLIMVHGTSAIDAFLEDKDIEMYCWTCENERKESFVRAYMTRRWFMDGERDEKHEEFLRNSIKIR